MKMGATEFSTGKSIVVLAIVVGCFAILWPKIFYPMMQAAFAMTAPGDSEPQPFRPRDRPPHRQPVVVNAEARELPADGTFIKEGRPFPHPSSRTPVKPQSKSGGAMGIVMPIYTIGIVVFFLYTVLKLVFKKSPEEEEEVKKPLVKDFHMDPDYHKFVCEQPPNSNAKYAKRPTDPPIVKTKERKKTAIIDEQNATVDDKDYEIYKLRKKLEETESAMHRIMKHMGTVSECLNNACMMNQPNAAAPQQATTTEPPTTTKPTLRLNKKTKQPFKLDGVEKISKMEATELNENETVESQKDSSADLDQQQHLKRDSSINSETSSFELLSQCLEADSSNEDMEDDEDEPKSNNKSSDDDDANGDDEDDNNANEDDNDANEDDNDANEDHSNESSCEDEEDIEDDENIVENKTEQSVKS